jgi:MATE family multidrug resistance protein
MVLGLMLLRHLYGIRPWVAGDVRRARLASIARLGLPMTLSILLYAGVYWAMLALVLSRLGTAAIAGLGIGFNAFEGVSFPFFLGIALAASSLVGRSLGAREIDSARLAVRNARRVGRAAGLGFALLFLAGRQALVPWFTEDPEVLAETLGYVGILAWSQLFVAEETVNEKVLQGAGVTRPIFWISTAGNLTRIPLAYLLAIACGFSSAGVWWAINATTLLKALLFRRTVDRLALSWPVEARGGVASPPAEPRLRPSPLESPDARTPWRASR